MNNFTTSANQNFQIYKRGFTTLTGPNMNTVRVYHNLGYIPTYLAYGREIDDLIEDFRVMKDNTAYYVLPHIFGVEDSVTKEYIEFVTRAGVSAVFRIYYVIFREKAE